MKRTLICMLLLAAGSLANAASFDCTKAATAIEKTICSDVQLSDLDSHLSQSYKKSLEGSSHADSSKSEQRAWLATVRNKCQDAACLIQAYTDRIAKLDVVPVPTITNQVLNTPVINSVDQPKENEISNSASQPVDAVEPSPIQPTVTPKPTPKKTQASPQTSTSNSAVSVIDTASQSHRGIGLTDLFNVLFAMGILGLIAGMFRPSLAARWISVPTRKKIFGMMLIYLVPIAVLSNLTKSPERIAYEKSVREQRDAERRERWQSGSGQQSRFQAAADRFVSVGQRVVKNGDTRSNPSCHDAFYEYQSAYLTDIGPTVVNARRNYSNGDGNLRAIEDTEASILEANTSNLESICGL